MRIDGGKPLNGVQHGRERRGANGANGKFTLGDPPAPTSSGGAHGPSTISSVDALIALQSVDDAGGRRARLRHGNEMLDLLDDIKLDMLAGGLSEAKLARLVDSLARRPAREATDTVEDVLDEIELRARVELAKRGRKAA